MPPSGYSTRSADGLVVFLREAVTDLRAEVEAGKHASLEVALRYEVSQISNRKELVVPETLKSACGERADEENQSSDCG